MDKEPIIEIRDALAIKEDTVLLNKVSLKVNEGEHLAVIGPNGAGKSSLIKLITGEIRPVHRKNSYIKINGETKYDLFSLRKIFGLVSGDLQEAYRRDYTGLEVVLSGFFGSIGTYGYQKITPSMKKRAKQMLEEIGIIELRDKYISRMSPGEARKILIARALVHDPKILILDEPTTNLDLKAAHEFLQTVRCVAGSNRTIILVTHHINEIIPEIERIVMVQEGKIFFDGIKEKALTSKRVSLLYGTKLRIHAAGKYYAVTYQ